MAFSAVIRALLMTLVYAPLGQVEMLEHGAVENSADIEETEYVFHYVYGVALEYYWVGRSYLEEGWMIVATP
jgi:hypothetical protein